MISVRNFILPVIVVVLISLSWSFRELIFKQESSSLESSLLSSGQTKTRGAKAEVPSSFDVGVVPSETSILDDSLAPNASPSLLDVHVKEVDLTPPPDTLRLFRHLLPRPPPPLIDTQGTISTNDAAWRQVFGSVRPLYPKLFCPSTLPELSTLKIPSRTHPSGSASSTSLIPRRVYHFRLAEECPLDPIILHEYGLRQWKILDTVSAGSVSVWKWIHLEKQKDVPLARDGPALPRIGDVSQPSPAIISCTRECLGTPCCRGIQFASVNESHLKCGLLYSIHSGAPETPADLMVYNNLPVLVLAYHREMKPSLLIQTPRLVVTAGPGAVLHLISSPGRAPRLHPTSLPNGFEVRFFRAFGERLFFPAAKDDPSLGPELEVFVSLGKTAPSSSTFAKKENSESTTPPFLRHVTGRHLNEFGIHTFEDPMDLLPTPLTSVVGMFLTMTFVIPARSHPILEPRLPDAGGGIQREKGKDLFSVSITFAIQYESSVIEFRALVHKSGDHRRSESWWPRG